MPKLLLCRNGLMGCVGWLTALSGPYHAKIPNISKGQASSGKVVVLLMGEGLRLSRRWIRRSRRGSRGSRG